MLSVLLHPSRPRLGASESNSPWFLLGLAFPGAGQQFLLVLCWARTLLLAPHLPTAAERTAGICPHRSAGNLGVASQSPLRPGFGLMKLIHLLVPTKRRLPQWPGHVTNLHPGQPARTGNPSQKPPCTRITELPLSFSVLT